MNTTCIANITDFKSFTLFVQLRHKCKIKTYVGGMFLEKNALNWRFLNK